MIFEIPDNKALDIIKNRTNIFEKYICELVFLNINQLIPLSKYLVNKRLDNSKKLLNLYVENNIALYKSVIIDEIGRRKTLAPPIIESRDGLYFICDGMHRIYTAMQAGVTGLHLVLVKNPVLPLPGKPLKWSDVRITPVQNKASEIFVDFVEEGYTGYSKYLNQTQYIE